MLLRVLCIFSLVLLHSSSGSAFGFMKLCYTWQHLLPPLTQGYEDHWFTDDCETCNPGDWQMPQPMCKGGYDSGVVMLIVHDVMTVLTDLMDYVRDIVDWFFEALRFLYCIYRSLTSQDIKHLEYPGDNKADKFVHRYKREALLFRFTDSTYQELRIARCVKRAIPTVLRVLYSPAKAIYYFFPFYNKLWVRLGLFFLKLMHTLVRIVIPQFMLTDLQVMHNIFGEWIGNYWLGFWKMVGEFLLDVGHSINEEVFVELWHWCQCFTDWDNRISTLDVATLTNLTYTFVEGIHDDVRWDGTARIDTLYCDLGSMIQSNELYEDHRALRHFTALESAKEEWCKAVWLPPFNSVRRTELKVKWTKWMVKNDQILDLAEFRCICIYASQNVGYNTIPMMNDAEERLRMVHRLDDIVRTVGLVSADAVEDTPKQDRYLEGIIECARTVQTFVYNVPEYRSKIKSIAVTFKDRYVKFIAQFPKFGSIPLKRRTDTEFEIITDILSLKVVEPSMVIEQLKNPIAVVNKPVVVKPVSEPQPITTVTDKGDEG